MKRNDIIERIRQQASIEMPDVLHKIDLASVEVSRPKKRSFSQFLSQTAFGHALQFTVVLFVVGFTSLLVYQSLNPRIEEQPALTGEVEIYGFQMVTAASMLQSFNVDPLSYTVPVSSSLVPLSQDTDESIISTKITDLSEYLNLMETMIGSKEALSYEMQTSDRSEYPFLLVYSSTDLLGNALEYRIYYQENPDELDPNKSLINGIMIEGDKEYALEGIIISTDGVKKARFTAKIDDDNYVTVSDQSTDSVQKYHYSRYENGVMTKENEIKMVLANEKVTAVITSTENNTEIEFRLSKKTDTETGKESVHIQYSCKSSLTGKSEEDGEIDVDVVEDGTTGSYQYHYNVQTNKGNSSQNHQYNGERTNKVDQDSDTENDTPGSHGNHGDGNNGSGNPQGSGKPKGASPYPYIQTTL